MNPPFLLIKYTIECIYMACLIGYLEVPFCNFQTTFELPTDFLRGFFKMETFIRSLALTAGGLLIPENNFSNIVWNRG